MTFPTVNSANSGVTTANATTATVNLPATVTAGDLLMVRIGFSSVGAVTWDNATAGAWTKLVDAANGTTLQYQIYIKTANGTEGGKTLSISFTSGQIAYRSVSFSAVDTAVTPEYNTTTGSSANPDSLSLTPSWGALDTLWLSDEANANGNTSVSAYPSGWTGGTNHTTGTLSGVGIGCSNLSLNTATVSPGAYTISTSKAWIAVTLGLKPITTSPVNGSGTSTQGEGATGSTSLTLTSTETSSQGQMATGTGALTVAASIGTGQGQGATGSATRTVNATVASTQGQGAVGTADSVINASASSQQGETATSAANRSINATSTSAEGQTATAASSLTTLASVSSAQGESTAGTFTATVNGTMSSSSAQGQGTIGTTSLSLAVTGTSAQGESVAGSLTRAVTATATSTQGQSVVASGALSITATATSKQAQGLQSGTLLSISLTCQSKQGLRSSGTANLSVNAAVSSYQAQYSIAYLYASLALILESDPLYVVKALGRKFDVIGTKRNYTVQATGRTFYTIKPSRKFIINATGRIFKVKL